MLLLEITKSQFRDLFHEYDRGNQFTYEGLGALYDYLLNISEELSQDINTDVIAFCCDYTEYDSIEEALEEYDLKTLEELEEETNIILIPNSEGVIVQNF